MRSITPPPYLPLELIHNILIRLSVKDIIRLSCVSRLWYHVVVRSRSFIKEYNKQSSTINSIHNCVFIRLTYKENQFSYYSFGQEEERIQRHPLYSLEEKKKLDLRSIMVAKHDGLILLQVLVVQRDTYYLALWNPTIAKHRLIPYEFKKYESERSGLKTNFGIGYNCDEDDLKVLVLEQSYLRRNNFRVVEYTELKVYSLSSNTWESIKLEHPYDRMSLLAPQRTDPNDIDSFLVWLMADAHAMVSLNNSRVAWLMLQDYVNEKGEKEINILVLTFDLARNKFHGLTVPFLFCNGVSFAALGGLLFVWNVNCVYIMKEEHSWTKLPTSAGCPTLHIADQLLLFDADRECVLFKNTWYDWSGSLQWYNIKTGVVTEADGWRSTTTDVSSVFVCEENLHLLLDGHPDGDHGYFTDKQPLSA